MLNPADFGIIVTDDWMKNYEDNIERILNELKTPVTYMEPKKLVYDSNIEIFIEFLRDVIEMDKPYQKTIYYWFLVDMYNKKLYNSPPEMIINRFLNLYHQISEHKRIKNPVVAFYNEKETFPVFYWNISSKKFERSIVNVGNKFFMVSGRHRVAISIFLNFPEIPVFLIENKFRTKDGSITQLVLPWWKSYIDYI